MAFFSLISTAFSSIFYGIIVTAVIMALLYVILKSLSSGIVRTPVFFVTGVVLAILLVIQTSLMIGAIQAKDAADATKIYLTQMLEDQSGIIGAQDSQQVMDVITDNFPIIGTFMGIADFSGHDISDLPEAMHESMIDFLNSYIWHRIWWILGILVVAVVIVICFDENRNEARRTTTARKTTGRVAPQRNKSF